MTWNICISFYQSSTYENYHPKLRMVFWSFRSRSKPCDILSIFYHDFIPTFEKYLEQKTLYPDFIQILSRCFRNSFYSNFILILSSFHLDKIWIKSRWNLNKRTWTGLLENARMGVMKWIVPVRHPYILNVTINTVFHPGDNVMVSMIVMICRMKIIVPVVLVSMDDFWILYLFLFLFLFFFTLALSLYKKGWRFAFP